MISQYTNHSFDSDYLTRRFSNDTALRSASVVESISTRPSSIVSTATSGDFTGRVSNHARRGSPWKRNVSSSSVLSTNRASPGPRPEVDLDEHPVPLLPSAVTAWPSRSVDHYIDGLAYSVSDQVTAAGRMAQRRRAKSRRSEMLEEELPHTFESIEDPGRQRPGVCVESSLEPARESILSIIEEGYSDAGCSTSEAAPMQHHASGEHVDRGSLSTSRHPSTRETRSCFGIDNMTEPTSGGSRSLTLTPATSIAGHTDLDDPEAHEMSEDNESISNFTDETDETFYEAFVATSLDPSLLPAALALKDHIASLVLAKVTNWARSYSPGQEAQGTSHNSASGADFGGGRANDATGRDGAGKKREFDERNPGGSDRGNGDDQDKRRKTEAAPTKEGVARMEANLACPFLKGHPDRKWPRCQKGWPSVHRIKEHVYKAHQLPIRCDRCFKQFNKEAELKYHHREDDRCEVVDPPQDVLGIDEETRRNLRSRANARNGTQEEKWRHMYRIIFPNVKDSDIPSPHYDLQALELPISSETRAQYRRFLRQEIPPRLKFSLFQSGANVTKLYALVDVFVPKITCEDATVLAPKSTGPRYAQKFREYKFVSESCNNSGVVLDVCQEPKYGNLPLSLGETYRLCQPAPRAYTVHRVNCSGINDTFESNSDSPATWSAYIEPNDVRYAITAAQFTINDSDLLSVDLVKSGCIICKIGYGIETSNATLDLMTGSVALSPAREKMTSLRNLSSNAFAEMIWKNLEQPVESLVVGDKVPTLKPTADPTSGPVPGAEVALFQLIYAQLRRPTDLEPLYQRSVLKNASISVLEGVAREFARQLLLVPESGNAVAQGMETQKRLHTRRLAVWIMAAGFCVLALVCLLLLWTTQPVAWVPAISGSIAHHAAILANSPNA
ncbi:hypothetical protein QQZ08_001463 [Neonectria magnoliae]|uniref:C2H2-type domain-containing protein n=1 Tax=Neonectria magnoliae TaxID=2732573 RepID=A0ABR1IF41_9HYPO